jgi:hypothetical protein
VAGSPEAPQADVLTGTARTAGATRRSGAGSNDVPANGPVGAVVPRLLTVENAAIYLGLGEWSVRHLIYSGIIRRVRVPAPGQGEIRRLLVDRQDLDVLVETWKYEPGPAV